MAKQINFNDNFRVRTCSDLDYEGIVVDIIYNNSTVATIKQDKGVENIEIKIFPPLNNEFWDFLL